MDANFVNAPTTTRSVCSSLQFNASNKNDRSSLRLPLLPQERPSTIPATNNGLRSPVLSSNLQRVKMLPNGKKSDYSDSTSDDSRRTRISRIGNEMPSLIMSLQTTSSPSAQLRHQNSLRYLRSLQEAGSPPILRTSSASNISRVFSDGGNSAKSWTSVGMGSTDGRKMIVRRVPTSPNELFNIVNPPTPPEEYLFDDSCDPSDDDNDLRIKPRRQQWSNKLQFVLACVGYSVGLGSVWRFPYLCYKSGGGVFLIPYMITMIVCGVPMLYMELAVGQFTGRGPIGTLGQLCPLFKGTGVASVVISFLMSTYYSVIIAYGIYYFFASFKSVQPWANCSNRWNNNATCWIPERVSENMTRPLRSKTPAEEFYDNKVLQISRGIEDVGALRHDLVACLLCAWVLVYFAIWKSIRSSGKVRYFTATFPFVLIIILMAKSLTLEGAEKGMQFFFRPKWQLLGDAKVWVNAAAQTFNSMGIAFGSVISFASYNKYSNNILQDTLAVTFVNAITSLLVGIFAFATIGNIAFEQNTSIEKVVTDGPGLIFVVFPQAMAKMPAAQVWAVLFFFMLLCLALNSQFAIVEVVVTSIQDGFPLWIRKNLMCHEVLVFVVCVFSFFCGLPNVTQGGIYFFQLIDHYAASISIMYVAFMEVIAIAWFYGVWRLSKNVEHMTGRAPSLYFKFCWTIAAPLLLIAVWIFYMIDYETPTYDNGMYRYPPWAIAVGWIITALSILCIPIFMIYSFAKAEGKTVKEKLVRTLSPNLYLCPQCNEHYCEHIENGEEPEEQAMLDIGSLNNGVVVSSYSSAPATPMVPRSTNGKNGLSDDILKDGG